MDQSSSPLETLRQLKEMLDAGALTPTEFEALKQQLVFSNTVVPGSPAPPHEAPPAAPPAPSGFSPPPPPAAPPASPLADYVASTTPPSPAAADPYFAGPAFPEAYVPDTPGPVAAAPARGWVADEFPASEAPPARNPLALVLSIGGLLALLGLVLYLSFNRPPSEHISSTSQTAADSVAAPIETGPQVEQLPPLPAEPETVRVAPAHPAAPLPARSAPAAADSVAPATGLGPDSAAGQ